MWVNDHPSQNQTWKVNGKKFERTVRIPQAALRQGDNVFVVHCFNAAGARGEDRVLVHYTDPEHPRKCNVYGLAVGVNKYKGHVTNVNKEDLDLDYAVQDARAFVDLWTKQKQLLYGEVKIDLLLDENATRDNILDALKGFRTLQDKKQLTPDDCLV